MPAASCAILCNDAPLLFRSELYASVSVVTALFYATAFGLKLNDKVWTALTFVLGLSLRLLAIRYKWEMPKFVFDADKDRRIRSGFTQFELNQNDRSDIFKLCRESKAMSGMTSREAP